MKSSIGIEQALFLLIFLIPINGLISQNSPSKWVVNNQIEIVPLTKNTYLHCTNDSIPGFGRVWSNGLILVSPPDAFLFDTPVSPATTEQLLNWLEESLKVKVIGFIPNHWHSDCMGGLQILKNQDIPSYANWLTCELAKKNSLPLPNTGFNDSLTLKLGEIMFTAYYLGAAHTQDNIVVWFPTEKILFGGCMVKSLFAKTLGNIKEGDVKAWVETISKLKVKFPDAKIVIPGHGEWGGTELFDHTLDLLNFIK